jgi:pSer/pThr/pTyr-binding forkhead associated (FHA) protein
MKSELIPLDGGAPIPITKDVTVVGRREFCDVHIDSPSLSKRHCVIVRTDGLLMVRDLATTNGTKVNGQKVLWAALLPNDRLTLGRMKFRIYLGPDAAASPSEQTTQLQPAQGQTERPAPLQGRNGAKGGGFAAPSPSTFPSSPPSDDDDDLIVLDDSEHDELFASSVAEDDSEILDLD